MSLCLIADEYRDFRKATMIVAGSNLARCTWEGSRTQAIRKQLELNNTTEGALDAAWQQLAPKTYAAAFAGKEVGMYISETDTVIPTQYQEEMVTSIKSAGADVTAHYSRNGHAASIAGFCLMGEL